MSTATADAPQAPPAAMSFLIETVLLGFPIPKYPFIRRPMLRVEKCIRKLLTATHPPGLALCFFLVVGFHLLDVLDVVRWSDSAIADETCYPGHKHGREEPA